MRLLVEFAFILSLFGLIQAFPLETRSKKTLYGVTYNAGYANGTCFNQQEMTKSLKLLKSKGIKNVRIYSQGCDQLTYILKGIKANGGGMSVLAAVWIAGNENDDQEISKLKSVLSKNYGNQYIKGILVGNEVLFENRVSTETLISKINEVKSFAKKIPVGTADILPSFTPNLVAAIDFVGANIHPFFGGQIDAKHALQNLKDQYNALKKNVGSKKILITETGWPSDGPADNKAVPSIQSAQTYINSLLKSKLPYYFFEWQDSTWKNGAIETSFGLLNAQGKLKYHL